MCCISSAIFSSVWSSMKSKSVMMYFWIFLGWLRLLYRRLGKKRVGKFCPKSPISIHSVPWQALDKIVKKCNKLCDQSDNRKQSHNWDVMSHQNMKEYWSWIFICMIEHQSLLYPTYFKSVHHNYHQFFVKIASQHDLFLFFLCIFKEGTLVYINHFFGSIHLFLSLVM